MTTKTKIICTLGPASTDATTLRKMVISGMDVARLNFSHGTHEDHQGRVDTIRTINKKYRRHIKILQDLEGHRIRLGSFKNHKPVPLKKHQLISLTIEDIAGDKNIIPIDYRGDLSAIKKGQNIFIDDGNICLAVKRVETKKILTEVVFGAELKERKGVNIPDAKFKFNELSSKDKQDIEFGINNHVDYIAQSFVRNKNDILRVRNIIKDRLPGCLIIAKIENREGIKNIDEILSVSDGIMIARGDMGISLPIYEVPVIQKALIKKCNKASKFSITATQMLESMVTNPRPTRAEVSDIANAIIDGTRFVMLSAETAVGAYPVETVRLMNQVILFTETHIK